MIITANESPFGPPSNAPLAFYASQARRDLARLPSYVGGPPVPLALAGLGSVVDRAKNAAKKAARDPEGAVKDAQRAADGAREAFDNLPKSLADVIAMIPKLIPAIEVRTAFTPPMVFKMADLLRPAPPPPPPGQPDPNPPPPPTTPEGEPIDGTKLIKPTVLLHAGTQLKPYSGSVLSYAPGGTASTTEWHKTLWILGGVSFSLVLLGVGVGYFAWGRRK